MKKILTIAAIAGAFLAFSPTEAEAGYKCRTVGTCSHCHKSIHSYYRPVRYSSGLVRYSWVTSHHTGCRSSYRSPGYSYRSYRSVPRISSYRSYGYNRGPSVSLHFGGTSLRFGGSRGYCR